MRIISDRNVLRINKDYFKILVCCILVNPVRVQYPKIAANSSGSFFSHTAKVSGKLKLVDTLVLGFTIHNSLVIWSLPSTPSHSDAVHYIALKYKNLFVKMLV